MSARTDAIRHYNIKASNSGEHMGDYYAGLADELHEMTDAEYDQYLKDRARQDMEEADYHEFLYDGGIHVMVAAIEREQGDVEQALVTAIKESFSK
jgi:hypothetical protein